MNDDGINGDLTAGDGFLAQPLIYKTTAIQSIIILGLKILMRYHYFLRELNIFSFKWLH